MDDPKLLCAAAVMGHTNMGQPCPTKERVQQLLISGHPRYPWRLSDFVDAISGHLFENDEHQQIFLGEAESWLKICRKPEFLAPWPKQAALFEE